MKVFIITPHAADPDFAAKQRIVLGVARDLGITVLYAEPSAGVLDANKSIKRLRSAGACIADLSYERPSCYFEVGYAQSLGAPVRLIALAGTPIHQVLGKQSVQFFDDLSGYQALVSEILMTFAVAAKRSAPRMPVPKTALQPSESRL